MPPELAFLLGIVTAFTIQAIYWRGFKRAHREGLFTPVEQPAPQRSDQDLQMEHLRRRLAVLERITTDPAERTARDIDALRNAAL
jgi:hypothetical protein